MEIELSKLRVELARANVTRQELARRLAVPPSTLSSWLNKVSPPPPDLASRVESALNIPGGTITINTGV